MERIPLSQNKVALVDDHEFLMEALASTLEKIALDMQPAPRRLNVTTASTLEKAIEMICQTKPPELVILDLNLSDENKGAATFRKFQEFNLPNVSVVIFTAMEFRMSEELSILKECLKLKARGSYQN